MSPVHLKSAGYAQKGNSFQMITPGTFLIQKGTILPESVHFQGGVITNGWSMVEGGAAFRRFKAELSAAGWHYFYMGTIQQTVFGDDRAHGMSKTLARLTAKMRLEGCNSVQIDNVARYSFFGIPYTCVSVHCCHIQTGMVLGARTE